MTIFPNPTLRSAVQTAVFFSLVSTLHGQVTSTPRLEESNLAVGPVRPRLQAVNQLPALDNFDRKSVVRFYWDAYARNSLVGMEFTGNHLICDAGDTGTAYKQTVLTRINYFRRMAGLPEVVFDAELNRKAQKAALMMSAQGELSHAPPPTWACYSSEGAAAAGQCNLAYGFDGIESIAGYMDDSGSNNAPVGHRRWILYPPQVVMGTGDVPRYGVMPPANALFVGGQLGQRPSTPEWVAWPPPGFVPIQVMPVSSGRWSFSYPRADFTKATVSIWNLTDDVPVSLAYDLRDPGGFSGIGDNTIVWRTGVSLFEGIHRDTEFEVTISGVEVGNRISTFAYVVTVIDPTALSLSIRRDNFKLLFSIPEYDGVFRLDYRLGLRASSRWLLETNAATLPNGTMSLELPETPRFYRAVIE